MKLVVSEDKIVIKLKDIADYAEVSLATVSLVVNNKPGVSEKTREKVLNIIKQVGYVPNICQIESYGITRSIRYLMYKKHGLAADENGFVSAITDGINIGAMKYGYEVILTTVNDSNKQSVLKMILDDPKDGIILLGTEMNSNDINFFKEVKTPIVIVDNSFEFMDYDCVVMNNLGATYKAIKYLYDNGFRKIGHLESSIKINNFLERKQGYIKTLDELHLEYNPDYTFKLQCTMGGAYSDMVKILESKPELPEAIFSDNDTIAVGAVKALKKYGVRIPQDLSIIGVDDIPFCFMIEPALSTIRIPKEDIGKTAVKRLSQKMEKSDASIMKIQIGVSLIERSSVKKII